jgi:hypothetical protein
MCDGMGRLVFKIEENGVILLDIAVNVSLQRWQRFNFS